MLRSVLAQLFFVLAALIWPFGVAFGLFGAVSLFRMASQNAADATRLRSWGFLTLIVAEWCIFLPFTQNYSFITFLPVPVRNGISCSGCLTVFVTAILFIRHRVLSGHRADG
jgi:hypothetical protein